MFGILKFVNNSNINVNTLGYAAGISTSSSSLVLQG
jgi:hypothetical protein